MRTDVRLAIAQQFRQNGYDDLVVYLGQQIHSFRGQGETFAMQHLHTEEEMSPLLRDLLQSLTLEERLEGISPEQRLEGISPEQRLEGISPEQRVQGLTLEQILAALAPDVRSRLIEAIQKEAKKE